jgi:hypothetical protein
MRQLQNPFIFADNQLQTMRANQEESSINTSDAVQVVAKETAERTLRLPLECLDTDHVCKGWSDGITQIAFLEDCSQKYHT